MALEVIIETDVASVRPLMNMNWMQIALFAIQAWFRVEALTTKGLVVLRGILYSPSVRVLVALILVTKLLGSLPDIRAPKMVLRRRIISSSFVSFRHSFGTLWS